MKAKSIYSICDEHRTAFCQTQIIHSSLIWWNVAVCLEEFLTLGVIIRVEPLLSRADRLVGRAGRRLL